MNLFDLSNKVAIRRYSCRARAKSKSIYKGGHARLDRVKQLRKRAAGPSQSHASWMARSSFYRLLEEAAGSGLRGYTEAKIDVPIVRGLPEAEGREERLRGSSAVALEAAKGSPVTHRPQ
jgi:hypothetical protein